MKGIAIVFLILLSACSQQTRLKSYYQVEAAAKPPPVLSKNSIRPVNVISPCYPMEAAIHNAEGWVHLEFSVNTKGEPTGIETKDASPQGLFEQCALESFSRWTFAPQKPEAVEERFQFVFQFKLDS